MKRREYKTVRGATKLTSASSSLTRPADRNEAAERLRHRLTMYGHTRGQTPMQDDLDAALAEERRRVVAQIRERLNMREVSVGPIEAFSSRSVRAILDEVAEDSDAS